MIILMAAMFGPTSVLSGEHYMPNPATHSKDFETMKTFIGTWEGRGDMGKGSETIKVTYELTSAGNAILERLFPGTPHEMMTVRKGPGHFFSQRNAYAQPQDRR